MTSFEKSFSKADRAGMRFLRGVLRELRAAYAERAKHDPSALRATADALGIDRTIVWRRLNGEVNMTADTIGQMAWALGLRPRKDLFEKRAASPDVGNRIVLSGPSGMEMISMGDGFQSSNALRVPAMVSENHALQTVISGGNKAFVSVAEV